MRLTLKCLIVPLVLLAGDVAGVARADILYSDTTNFSGQGYTPGGAATDASGHLSTAMAADDITVASGYAGAAVNSITFSVTNLNSGAVTADVDLRIYSLGANGQPGTILASLNFNPISFAAGAVLFTYSSSSPIFTVPTNGQFYVGEFFDNDNATGTTAAQLNNLGLAIFAPPTVGSSNDSFFQSSAGGSSNTTSNPAGSLVYFGGNPTADFGFAFSGTPAAVPEPSSIALLGLGLGAAGIARRRRR